MEALQWLKSRIRAYGKFGGNTIFRHGTYALLGSTGVFTGNILTALALTALLPVQTYGTYAYIIAVIGFFSSFTLTGIGGGITQAVAEKKIALLNRGIQMQLIWSLPAIAAFNAYCLYLGATAYEKGIALPLAILGNAFFISNCAGVAGAILAGTEHFKKLGVIAAVSAFAAFGAMAAAALTGNLVLIACGSAAVSTASAAYLYYSAAQASPKTIASEEEIAELGRFSGHLSAVNVIAGIADNIDKIALFSLLGPAKLGIYSLAVQMADTGKGFIKSALGTLTPRLTRMPMRSIRERFKRHIVMGMAAGSGLCLLYWAAVPTLVAFLFPRYAASGTYAVLLASSFVFIVPITYTSYIFQSKKMVGALYALSLIPNALRIATYTTGAAIGGIKGLIAARIGMHGLSFALNVLWISSGFLTKLTGSVRRSLNVALCRIFLETRRSPCLVCGLSSFVSLHGKERYGLPLKIERCAHCGFVMQNPVPTEKFLDYFYGSGVYRTIYLNGKEKEGEDIDKPELRKRSVSFVHALADGNPAIRNGAILDYGCGEGIFLKGIREIFPGMATYAVEPNSRFITPESRDSIDAVYADLRLVPPCNAFDIITLWHVLEHLANPRETLIALRQKMKPRGLLVIEVPNVEKYAGTKNFHIAHISHFSPSSIITLLERCSLKIRDIETDGAFQDERFGMRVVAAVSE